MSKINYEFLIVRYFTLLGNIFPQFVTCMMLCAINLEKGFYVTGLWVGAYAMNLVIKHTVCKARPDEALRRIKVKGYSFASGHSVTSLALYFSIAKYFQPELATMPQLQILVFTMPFLLGLSRIYLRVHFIEDVVGGWVIAYMYLAFFGDWIVSLMAQVYPLLLILMRGVGA